MYRSIFVASLVTQIARWMHETSGAWLMTTLTDLPLLVALMQTAMFLPVFLLAIPAGVLGDLFDRRRWLMGAQTWLVVTALALGVLTLMGHVRPWSLLTLTLFLGVGTALTMPAMDAIIPELVDKRDLPGAVALKGLTINAARAIGPAIGGFLLAVIGPGTVFVINAAAFGLVVIVLYRWKRQPGPAVAQPQGFREALRVGVSFTRSSQEMRAVIIRAVAFLLCASALWSLLPLVARGAGLGPDGYGWMLAIVGTGAVFGVLVLPRVRERFSVDWMLASSMVSTAAGLTGFALSTSLPVLLAVGFVTGIGWIGYATVMNTVAQQVLPGWVRARGLAIYIVAQQGAMALGAAIWGTIASVFTVAVSLMSAAVLLIACLATVRMWPLSVYSPVR